MAWTKDSGHWRWQDKGESTSASTAAAMKRPDAETGDSWGGWVYHRDHRTLTFEPGTRNSYEVRLEHLKTAVDFVDCLVGLRSKEWVSQSHVGDFIEAVDDLVGLGSYLRRST